MICALAEEPPLPATGTAFRGRIARALLKGEGGLSGHNPAARSGDHLGRMEGRIWPVIAHTMIGLKRLDNLEFCIEQVIAKGVPGDLIETGVWRGGATIFMRALLTADGVTDSYVWSGH